MKLDKLPNGTDFYLIRNKDYPLSSFQSNIKSVKLNGEEYLLKEGIDKNLRRNLYEMIEQLLAFITS